MREFSFEPDRTIPAGRVVFRMYNAGTTEHYMTLVPLPEDMPPINEQLHGSERRALEDFAGIYPRRPGEGGTFAVDLTAGRRYAMLCFVQDEDGGENHALKGMTFEFRPMKTTTSASR